jgi:uncharacterized membrane protein YfcA
VLRDPFSWAHILELLAIGAVTGLLSGLLGVGGGFVLVPLLTLVGLDIKVAIGTSLAYIAVTAASGALRHLRQGTVDVVLAASIVLAAAVSAQAGAEVAAALEGAVLTIAFGLLIVGVALWFLFGPRVEDREVKEPKISGRWGRWLSFRRVRELHGRSYTYYVDVRKGVVIGLIVGFASGLFGVGGGFLMVPLVTMWMLVPIPVAIGSDLLGVLITALSGVAAHYRLGNIDFPILLPLLAGGVIMAQVGAWLAYRLPQHRTRAIFVTVLLIAASYVIYGGVAELFFDTGVPEPGGAH